jgi:hypothetical protein
LADVWSDLLAIPGSLGNGDWAEWTYSVPETGPVQVGFAVMNKNVDNALIQSNLFVDAVVTVTGAAAPSATPEPSAAVLAASGGILVVWGLRRKKRHSR